jgi:phosphate transport system protein
MVRHFEQELDNLKKRLLDMGKLVEGMINSSIKSILDRDESAKNEVFDQEAKVNKCQIEIDEYCIAMIALHQPAAVDLRFITAAMKINSDLERMGDQAVNIAGHSVRSMESIPEIVTDYISRMSAKVKAMVRDCLDAFVARDVNLAEKVLLSDDEVDSSKKEIFTKLTDCMQHDPNTISHSLEILLVSRHLERLGDHATNIAEDVIYMVMGKDIRHHMLDK